MKREDTGSVIAICIDNADYEMSLERRKVYPVLPDADAAQHDYVRVIDETGEDYLFPAICRAHQEVDLSVPGAVATGRVVTPPRHGRYRSRY